MTRTQGQDAADEDADTDAEEHGAFGSRSPTRFGADVVYRGHVDDHDYLVQVRHQLLDTSAVITIDGARHDPVEEKKAAQAADREDVDTEDSLALRIEDGFVRTRYTVRRPTDAGEMKDREVVEVRTAGLGGAGEVDVRSSWGAIGAPLVPEEDSPSAAREARKAEHPVRFGLLSSATTAARYLVPLLGIGAIFSGLLRPLREWIVSLVRSVLMWLDETTLPLRQWIGERVDPILSWITERLQPVRDARDWVIETLFGWIPDLSIDLPIPDLPDWVLDVAVPIAVVVLAFVATYVGIRRRRQRLEDAKRPASTEPDPDDGTSTERESRR